MVFSLGVVPAWIEECEEGSCGGLPQKSSWLDQEDRNPLKSHENLPFGEIDVVCRIHDYIILMRFEPAVNGILQCNSVTKTGA